MPKTSLARHDFDLICLSHLRWDFVYQRPQHLMSRFSKEHRVFVFEEPIFTNEPAHLDISPHDQNLFVAVPKLQHETSTEETPDVLRRLINELIAGQRIENYLAWYYTPMMLDFSRHLDSVATVYDPIPVCPNRPDPGFSTVYYRKTDHLDRNRCLADKNPHQRPTGGNNDRPEWNGFEVVRESSGTKPEPELIKHARIKIEGEFRRRGSAVVGQAESSVFLPKLKAGKDLSVIPHQYKTI